MNNKEIGNIGEDLATRFLINKGYSILERNYRYKQLGEIDIVTQKDNRVVFVEVKSILESGQVVDKGGYVEFPIYNISKNKLKTLYRLMQMYLLQNRLIHLDYTLDGLALVIDLKNKGAKIKHFKDLITDNI